MSDLTTIGQYQILRKIAQGGMAEVFLARQGGVQGFEKLVVVKQILPQLAGSDEFVKMFLDEARTAADLRHPNIVQIIEVGEHNGTYYIVMEFLHGQDLRQLLRKQVGQGARVPLQHALQMVIDSAAGLHYAHQKSDMHGRSLGIVHRDISPQNIIVTYEGASKIVDFGIAKAATQTVKTKTGVIKGKYAYMSPEQASMAPIDHRSDQFALGVVAYELTLAKRLFKYPNEMMTLHAVIECKVPPPAEVLPGYPQELSDIIMRALSADPDDRFTNTTTFAEAIEEFMAREGMVHSPARVSEYVKALFSDELEEETRTGVPTLPEVDEGSQPSDISRAKGQSRPGGAVRVRRDETQRSAAKSQSNGAPPKALIAALVALVLLGGAGLGVFMALGPSTAPLIIESSPPGARVSLDGTAMQKLTPTVIQEAQVDKVYVVVLEKDGFKPEKVQVRVLKGQGGRVSAKLKPKQVSYGVVKFSTQPAGAKVYINGAPVQSRTPFEYPKLRVGDVLDVIISRDGYQDVTRKVTVGKGITSVDVKLLKN